jgi:hypothetical protein
MFSIDMCKALTEAEEGQHCQDHDNQADEIDKTVHGFLHMSRAILDRQSSGIGKVPEISRKKLQPTILKSLDQVIDAMSLFACFTSHIRRMLALLRTAT